MLYFCYTRGLRQLVAQRPEVTEMVQNERYIMKPGVERAKLVFSSILENPLGLPFIIPSVGVLELARFRGNRQYRRDPHDASWESVRSTKLLK